MANEPLSSGQEDPEVKMENAESEPEAVRASDVPDPSTIPDPSAIPDPSQADDPTVIPPEPVVAGAHFAAAVAEPSDEASGKKKRNGRKKHRKKKREHTGLILLLVLVIIVAAIYGGGVYVFSTVCYPGTTIAGVDVSLMDRTTAIERIESALANYSLTVSGDGFEWTYEPETVDEVFDAEATFDEAVDGNEPFEWPVRLYEALAVEEAEAAESDASEDEVDLTTLTVDDIELPDGFDLESFQTSLSEAVTTFNGDKTGTFTKESAYDESTGLYSAETALENRLLSEEQVLVAALYGVSTLERTVEIDESYLEPLSEEITEEDIQAACDAANALIDASSELTMGGTVVATLDGEQLLEWVSFSDAGLVVDEDAVTAWVGELADKLDTVGSERTYTRADGEVITISGGTYGWLSDEATLVDTIVSAISSGEVTDIEVPTKQTADVYTAYGEADWGAYVDVDISEQYARYYDADGNIIWEAGIISGNPNKGNDTPQGIYYVVSKGEDITLVGDTYETPVSYWMAFVGGSVGFHDATWQDESNFGNPEAYLSVGSHGCVNLSYSSAEALYEVLEVGTCVIVHD